MKIKTKCKYCDALLEVSKNDIKKGILHKKGDKIKFMCKPEHKKKDRSIVEILSGNQDYKMIYPEEIYEVIKDIKREFVDCPLCLNRNFYRSSVDKGDARLKFIKKQK